MRNDRDRKKRGSVLTVPLFLLPIEELLAFSGLIKIDLAIRQG